MANGCVLTGVGTKFLMAVTLAAFLFRAASLLASILAIAAGGSPGVAEFADAVGSRLSSCGSRRPAQKLIAPGAV